MPPPIPNSIPTPKEPVGGESGAYMHACYPRQAPAIVFIKSGACQRGHHIEWQTRVHNKRGLTIQKKTNIIKKKKTEHTKGGERCKETGGEKVIYIYIPGLSGLRPVQSENDRWAIVWQGASLFGLIKPSYMACLPILSWFIWEPWVRGNVTGPRRLLWGNPMI